MSFPLHSVGQVHSRERTLSHEVGVGCRQREVRNCYQHLWRQATTHTTWARAGSMGVRPGTQHRAPHLEGSVPGSVLCCPHLDNFNNF